MRALLTVTGLLLAVNVFALNGAYNTDCYTTGEQNKFDLVELIETDGTTFSTAYTRYDSGDGTCTTPALTGTIDGTAVFGAPNQTIKHVDRTLTRFLVTLHTQAEVDKFNGAKLCKHEKWALETEIDVFTLDCTGVLDIKAGDIIYSVYKIENGQVFLGQGSEKADGNSTAQRHVEFSDQGFTKK